MSSAFRNLYHLLDCALQRVVSIITITTAWSAKVFSVLVFFMMVTIIYEVIARYFLNKPTIWSMETSIMLWGTYFVCSGAYATLTGGHVKMDMFYSRWSTRKKAIVDACTFPAAFLFLAVIVWKTTQRGIHSVLIRETSHTLWSPPLYHWKVTIGLGCLLLILQACAEFLKNLRFVITGEAPSADHEPRSNEDGEGEEELTHGGEDVESI
jgi:TRAP-type mannitol/chloroaromatic compound transport system permease small subunit